MTAISQDRPSRAVRRSSRRGRLTARAMIALAGVLRRLPPRPLHHVADAIGGVLYRTQPERRKLVSDNLLRVCRYLVEHDMAGQSAAGAANDGQQLKRLVRGAFGHYVRGYLESATLPAYASEKWLARVVPDDPDVAAQAFPDGEGGPMIIVGMHFGALEVPALWTTGVRGVRITAPMETVADPDLQSYFERTRAETGIKVVPLAGAATALRTALGAGEAVALVADRPVGGSGALVELFGAPARLPTGPAALAIESGAPAWLVATRRVGYSEYRVRLERIEPQPGTRREQLSSFMAAEAAAFERAVADAPEQWWTLFFPIWDSPRQDARQESAA